MAPDPLSILFVCMGNICRSPTAEGVFRSMLEQKNLADRITCDSAGTIGYHAGDPPDPRMRATAARHGYQLTSRARKVVPEDFDRFSLIVAMDTANYRHLLEMAPSDEKEEKVRLMMDFARHHPEQKEVPDPYYGGDHGFEEVITLIEDACAGLLDSLTDSRPDS